jgi:hypothetical protein
VTAPPVVPSVHGVFDTTVDAVYDLAPEADRVTDPNNSTLPTPITEDTVARWIVDISNAVAGSIGPWGDITGEVALSGVKSAARACIANGAASYLEAARYPTRANMNDSSYAGVLWARYTAGVTALKEQVKLIIAEDDPGEVEQGGPSGGPFGSFPPTYFADGMWW